MPYPSISGFQVAKSPTQSNSLVTSPPYYIGDFKQLAVSVSTQSAGAIQVQISNEDGFQNPIPETSWVNILTPSINSIFAMTVGPRWSRVSCQSLSSHTIIFTGHT